MFNDFSYVNLLIKPRHREVPDFLCSDFFSVSFSADSAILLCDLGGQGLLTQTRDAAPTTPS